MKTVKMGLLFLWMFGAAAIGLALGQSTTIVGQKIVRQQLVTWTAASGNWSGKTHGILLGGSVYMDTSSTGQANQFKRTDNTTDSCSNPFFIVSDSLGGTRPVWEYRGWGKFRSVDKDSGRVIFRVQTREVYGIGNRTIAYDAWTRAGANQSSSDVTVQDSIIIKASGTTARISQYGFFSTAGVQARLCPDDDRGSPWTASGATDTVHFDSVKVFVR